jgi:uncharacterized protein (DUF58 family)
MVVAVAVIGTWWLVAHNSGAGWVQAIGDAVFGTLLVGIVGPSVVLARARVRVSSAPVDGTAGLPLEVKIDASTRVRVSGVHPHGPQAFVGPIRRRRSNDDSYTFIPQNRGVYDWLTVDVATGAPFGLQWWTRRLLLPLPSTLHVAPRRGQPIPLPVREREHTGESVMRKPGDVGEPRGVRAYRAGDNRRYVHWPATAHARELMVREMERPSAEPITVQVSLPSDPHEAERVAERALASVVLLLDRGTAVVLGTIEESGAALAPVEDRRQAGRRLARAVAAQDAAPEAAGVRIHS